MISNKWGEPDERNILLIYWIFISVKIWDDERLSRKKKGFESNDIEWIML